MIIIKRPKVVNIHPTEDLEEVLEELARKYRERAEELTHDQ